MNMVLKVKLSWRITFLVTFFHWASLQGHQDQVSSWVWGGFRRDQGVDRRQDPLYGRRQDQHVWGGEDDHGGDDYEDVDNDDDNYKISMFEEVFVMIMTMTMIRSAYWSEEMMYYDDVIRTWHSGVLIFNCQNLTTSWMKAFTSQKFQVNKDFRGMEWGVFEAISENWSRQILSIWSYAKNR